MSNLRNVSIDRVLDTAIKAGVFAFLVKIVFRDK